MILNNVVITSIIFIFLVTIVDADSSVQTTYVSSIDPDLGFYKITDSTIHRSISYINRTIIINQGDVVIWKNDGDKPGNITIVSEQKLFTDKLLRLIGDVYGYTFDQPGKYIFYTKERKTLRQIIIVNGTSPTAIPTITPTITRTVTPTMVPNFSSSKPITASITNSENITNITNGKNITNTSSTNILNDIINRIDINRILNDYIAGILIIITYIIYKNRSQKL